MTAAGLISRTSHCGRLECALLILLAAVASSVGTAYASSLDLTISGTPPTTVVAGQAYSFTPTVSGLPAWYYEYFPYQAFTVKNKPAWATFNKDTGALTGTPTSSEVGTDAGIVITVSKTAGSVSLPAFSIQVTSAVTAASATSAPPTITGTPPTSVVAGKTYAFLPSASDPNGDAISFSIANKPSWATFSIATGRLSGTTDTADIGAYPDIVISVSDGNASAALPSFTIDVQPTATPPPATSGTATLTWTPPTTNTDGSPLTDLAGYVVYYGTSATDLQASAQVTDPTATSYSFANLAEGTWYFAVAAYASDGTQSAQTSVMSVTVE